MSSIKKRVDTITRVEKMLIEDRLGNVHIDDEPNEDEACNGNAPSLPKGLLVTNLPAQLFEDRQKQGELEEAFRAVDPSASFNYFRSFTRVRVNFSSHELASTARHLFDLTVFGSSVVRCFLTQPIVVGSGAPHLLPPKREKQFLISPPASPPVGWRPMEEGEPIINYDILSALAHLAPGEAHELHPPSHTQPGIIVHVCEQELGGDCEGEGGRRPVGIRLPQTARPCPPHQPPQHHR